MVPERGASAPAKKSTGRKRGAQSGHKGTKRMLADNVDESRTYYPDESCTCGGVIDVSAVLIPAYQYIRDTMQMRRLYTMVKRVISALTKTAGCGKYSQLNCLALCNTSPAEPRRRRSYWAIIQKTLALLTIMPVANALTLTTVNYVRHIF